ncbi:MULTISPECIES: hypothetical protein [Ectothiorhodospira]|jgi:hypothetical protein|uniref:DUF72 domain-containing protein n=1 Tax=Ectothiorhodospira marina TaxID=1396821 RepID=A0A1H7H9Q3_9GAMM|nr:MULTISPECIES: hypothetical protein [Ectothiorhodospira]MCG5515110.1 hypothetical protein [Ectothiorhodospira sp. 9100]MCG5517827.1 hypothetical protein [Ectothiorhodospira sp. 9905]SEK45760.1 hypothetical protein SAMN05444515_10276 [Ectothiorhodospira marina]
MGYGKPFHLTLGARDWEHPAWVAQFYPQDMPASWRLCFYANEFSTVLLPPQRWQGTSPADWQGWLGEVREDFRFFLEVGGGALEDVEHLRRMTATLGPQLGGLVLPGASHETFQEAVFMRPGQGRLPCYSVDAPAARTRLWMGPATEPPCAPVGWMGLPAGAHPRMLRENLEAFARCAEGRSGVLFLDAPPAVMGQTITVARLLGFT